METALTFGSVGDIIAICQIVIELSRALGSSAGSARQYQDLREDLERFTRTLMQVIAVYERHENSLHLNNLDKEIRRVVDDCAVCLRETLDFFHVKYHRHLQPGGSSNVVKDAVKKLEWSFTEKEKVLALQEKVKAVMGNLTLLTTIAAQKSARADASTIKTRAEEVKNILGAQQTLLIRLHNENEDRDKTAQQHMLQLGRIEQRLANQEQSWSAVFSPIQDLKQMITQVAQLVTNMQSQLAHASHPRTLDPTLNMPIYFEDALGTTLEIPLAWIHDWNMLYKLVEHRFENLKGHDMVLRREYALEESCTGKDFDVRIPWSASLRRGMKINMSMVFTNVNMSSGRCPRCGTLASAPKNQSVCCTNTNCGMWFRLSKWKPFQSLKDLELLKDPKFRGIYDEFEYIGTLTSEAAVTKPADFQRVRLVLPAENSALGGQKIVQEMVTEVLWNSSFFKDVTPGIRRIRHVRAILNPKMLAIGKDISENEDCYRTFVQNIQRYRPEDLWDNPE
ncbi:hypothetical protein F5X68DRAFT_209105 [Plectosphaerella plurivora]|uniref:Ubiquitin-like domain-containing protein n=1 Tax=Plectosphaerella plurivora TaxID=936078 RepID=A0A9P8VAF2_9PEZI|nr:hypothetical protein F5X68DRAFT_209105 [Plectosphaerella plurivora]